MEVYYVNHKNQKIDLGCPPYQMQIGDIFNYTNKYEGNNNKITRIYKDISTISTAVTIEETNEITFAEAVNNFFDVTEADVAAGVRGKLYVGEYYLLCNIYSSDKAFWKETNKGMENAVKLLVPYPYWCREVKKAFLLNNADTSNDSEYLNYPFSYPYRYSVSRNLKVIENDHYAPCDFILCIYGPCTNPAIRINGHLYEVLSILYNGEYMLIDSRENTVFRYMSDGTKVNLFNWRNKESNLFQKIPEGRCSVIWQSEAFGFDLLLLQERGEPKWSL